LLSYLTNYLLNYSQESESACTSWRQYCTGLDWQFAVLNTSRTSSVRFSSVAAMRTGLSALNQVRKHVVYYSRGASEVTKLEGTQIRDAGADGVRNGEGVTFPANKGVFGHRSSATPDEPFPENTLILVQAVGTSLF